MKKVLFLIHRFHYSGAAKALQLIANGLAEEKKYDVTIATYSDTVPCYYVHPDISVVSGKNRGNGRISKYIIPLKETRKILEQQKPDIVIAFLNNASFYSIIASYGLKHKTIVCERCDPYNENTKSLLFMRIFFRFAQGSVFQTEGARVYYKDLLDKSTVIPNAVDPSLAAIKVKPFLERKNVINVFSRLEIKQKRQDILLQAFRQIHSRIPDIVLNIYGDGPDENQLKEMCKELSLEGWVNFKGSTNKATELLSDCKLTILTSDYEGIPNGVIDAMAIGIPVVATDTSPGGVRMLIEDGVNGLIVPCGDVKGVADAACKILMDAQFADMLSSNSVLINERFSERAIIGLWDMYLDRF